MREKIKGGPKKGEERVARFNAGRIKESLSRVEKIASVSVFTNADANAKTHSSRYFEFEYIAQICLNSYESKCDYIFLQILSKCDYFSGAENGKREL